MYRRRTLTLLPPAGETTNKEGAVTVLLTADQKDTFLQLLDLAEFDFMDADKEKGFSGSNRGEEACRPSFGSKRDYDSFSSDKCLR